MIMTVMTTRTVEFHGSSRRCSSPGVPCLSLSPWPCGNHLFTQHLSSLQIFSQMNTAVVQIQCTVDGRYLSSDFKFKSISITIKSNHTPAVPHKHLLDITLGFFFLGISIFELMHTHWEPSSISAWGAFLPLDGRGGVLRSGCVVLT